MLACGGDSAAKAAAKQPQLSLEARRRDQGISLEQIAGTTKIGLRFLQAIEAEEFGLLPGGLFNTSYIRQYAAAVGCDVKELLDYYHARTGAHPPTSEEPKRSGFRWLRFGLFSLNRKGIRADEAIEQDRQEISGVFPGNVGKPGLKRA